HENRNELQDQDHDDNDLEELAARDGDLFDDETVNVVQRLQLLLDTRLPPRDAQPRAHERQHAGGVDVADDLQRIFRPVGDLVDVDEQRVQLVGGARRPAAKQVPPPARSLQRRIDASELHVEQRVVIAELEQLGVRELEQLQRRGGASLRVVDERRVPSRHDE